MKMKTVSILSFCVAIAAGAAAMLSGCETESADTAKITITPSSATLTRGNPSVALTASGGWNYVWDLDDENAGSLDKHSGSKVVYTAKTFGTDGTNVEQRITVSAAGSTNLLSATATITQK